MKNILEVAYESKILFLFLSSSNTFLAHHSRTTKLIEAALIALMEGMAFAVLSK